MKERPILFSGPMVRAILDCRKTQTRRVMKTQPTAVGAGSVTPGGEYWYLWPLGEVGGEYCEKFARCPFGIPGERLWAREGWGYRGTSITLGNDYATHKIEYRADGVIREIRRPLLPDYNQGTPNQRPQRPGEDDWDYGVYLSQFWKSWRPSIHMPRWASRLNLEVVDVRVERLNDISEDDARAEGVACVDVSTDRALDEWCRRSTQIAASRGEPRPVVATNVGKFAHLWDRINGKAHPWRSNPWVWVVEFKPIDDSVAAMAATTSTQL